MEEDQSSCSLAQREDLEDLLWVLYSPQCSETMNLPLLFSPEGQCSITVLCCCRSSHSWLYCSSAGQWEGSVSSVASQFMAHSGLCTGEKWIFSGRLSTFGRKTLKQLKYINAFYLFWFFLSLIVRIKGEYFFSQYTFQQTILSNHQR